MLHALILKHEESLAESVADVYGESSESSMVSPSSISKLCQMMERSRVINCEACKIVNACLQDMKLDQPEHLLESSKLRRQRIYWRNKEVEANDQLKSRSKRSEEKNNQRDSPRSQ